MKKIVITLLFLGGFFLSLFAQSSPFASLNNEEFAKVIAQKKVQIVDVRTPNEFVAGHIHGAVNIDVNGATFNSQVELLKKKNPVAVYCRSGKRSKIAANKLVEKGFTVYELDKGISQWNGAVEK